jgi:hypothetical protein
MFAVRNIRVYLEGKNSVSLDLSPCLCTYGYYK